MAIFNTTQGVITTTEEQPEGESLDITDVVYCIIAAFGIFGNGLVLFVFFKVPQLRVTNSVLIGNQAIVDFISAVLLVLLFLLPDVDFARLSDWSQFVAVAVCKIWDSQYVFWACIKISTVNLVFLTLERYFAVVFPHQYRKKGNKRNMVIIAISAWFFGALIEVSAPIIHEVYDDGKCSSRGVSDNGRRVIAYVSLMMTIVIPVIVMTFVYTSIIITLRPKKTLKTSLQSRASVSALSSDATLASTAPSDGVKRSASTSLSPDPGKTPSSRFSTETLQTTTSMSSIHPAQSDENQQKVDQPVERKPTTKDRQQMSSRDRARRNILLTMFLVCATYVTCWTPDIVLYFHHNVVRKHDWSEPFHRFVILLAFSNVCTNPVIYTLKYRQFQRGLKTVFVKGSTWNSTK